MSDNKGGSEKSKKQQHSTPSPPVQETLEHQQEPPVIITSPAFISPPPPPPSSSSHYISPEPLNPKRPRYTSTTGQWKLLPSPSHKHIEKTSSPVTTQPPPPPSHAAAASSSDTASSPSHSPRPSISGQEINKSEGEHQYQLRKGKYVSPVWKPNEMLWLARAWRVQYQGGGVSGQEKDNLSEHLTTLEASATAVGGASAGATTAVAPAQLQGRGKTRAEKDREVAEFLQRNGVNRDAKTAGTKWDNMLGEFRKVYEWERGGEREQIGKSYFRLSPYERKLHRLPASFDEEVFEELAQFMGSRMRTPQTTISRSGSPFLLTSGDQDSRLAIVDTKSFPPPTSFLDDHDHIPFSSSGTILT